MENNSEGGQVVSALDTERECLKKYISSKNSENKASLNSAIEQTKKAIDAVDLDYEELGENQYAQLYALKSCYEVYCEYRTELLEGHLSKKEYVAKTYDVYNMQDYLVGYSEKYIEQTLKDGNAKYKELIPKVFAVPLMAITINILLFIVIIELSRRMDKDFTEPVLKLANASRKIAANDFYIEDVHVNNQDEVGELVHAFNKMKYATGEYIDALEKKRDALDKLHVKELENLEVEKQLDAMNLQLLKSQINPHFLFNTLNVIGGMANLEGADITEEMIKALSALFRYNLKNQDKEVLLSQELKVAENYMYLQKMRFGMRVKYIVNCDVDPDKVVVPTFILQPLLENCIIHGISPKLEGGKIYLTVSHKEDKLVLVVTDTGEGMDAERLKTLRESFKEQSKSIGIGTGNIYRRIKAMYKDADMEVDSSKGGGTSISITLPFMDSETYYSKEND
ncbi:sensor histidine kinase [Pseudobutyrivibrio sp. YE44]|uniref:sensor histidine kinase n=1 Tax=Pseudobutyrivibrio sp. YE44 TaxID=1520802 RepID=UPI0015A43E45|nr:sensor histidine kinase [Pseudobutyrivibrio sp. YE44]